jgi:transposase
MVQVMKNYSFYVGIDISKEWFDFCILTSNNELVFSGQHQNNSKGVAKMIKEIRKVCKVPLSEVLFCMEHTGIYGELIKAESVKLGLSLWVEAGWKITKNLGRTRSKNDRDDARRIAEYSFRFRDRAVLWVEEPENLKRLRLLLAYRSRIIQTLSTYLVPIKELRATKQERAANELERLSKSIIKEHKAELAKVEKEIDALIIEKEECLKTFKLATSIPGVGRVTALWLILYTRNFTLFDDPRQLSCYAGCAPFEKSSGTSTRGKTRVSHYANKILKTALHMAALSAIKSNPDLKEYYIRKKKEGKHSMLVLNAVRNKLIHNIMAVIKRQTPWVAKFSKANENLAVIN